ncbi:amino acid permease [Desulforamulus ruminis]|uniref:Amino acid permease-associated region n=1 Tax=Desulforamulus ruminis (strain ATCC 23193 / DSM 2154 / NCIMB 8452 / DL) TaxID=696281 RepID=F6DK51_DESRL|nr:amino acid permease [Desulforamulus ruminis]AEG60365.1 amino acid permease-associated region [Desulforamulus ruminis DSM 2154]
MQAEKGLSVWQLTMMALGTVIGGSFFLGSAVAINAAGPAIIISFLLGGALVYIVLFALSEMTVADPAPGSFRTYAERYYGPAAGFIMGWVYWTGLVLAMSSEATAVSIFLRNWVPDLSLPLIGSLIIIFVSLLNLLGAERLSHLESGLAVVKLLAIVGFIIIGLALIGGFISGVPRIGAGELLTEPFFPGGLGGIAGSMLIVMFTYAGFEIIGLAASETKDPHRTVPQAIRITVASLIGLYVIAIVVLLPLIPTGTLSSEVSPLVQSLARWRLTWVGNVVNTVLITAILSTMLAAMFGLGRMIRSLAWEGHAPAWLRDQGEIPYRGILFSGVGMLLGLGLGLILPQQVYLFLVSAGGFSLLLAYVVILASHYKFRKLHGCPNGHCQLPGYPVTSWIGLAGLIAIIISMPLVPGQGAGLVAGLVLLAFFAIVYQVKRQIGSRVLPRRTGKVPLPLVDQAQFELAEELSGDEVKLPEKKSRTKEEI